MSKELVVDCPCGHVGVRGPFPSVCPSCRGVVNIAMELWQAFCQVLEKEAGDSEEEQDIDEDDL